MARFAGAASVLMLVTLSCVSPRSTPVSDGAAGAGPGGGTGGGGGSGGSTPPVTLGTIGAPCRAGDGCDPGLACIGSALVPGNPDRYCAPTCAAVDDCGTLAGTSYTIQVPSSYRPFFSARPSASNWPGTISRGVTCAPLAANPAGPKYCAFGCPHLLGVAPGPGGENACYCLPGYSLAPDKVSCTFGSGHQCSIFSFGTDEQRRTLLDKYGIQTQKVTCDVCNSDMRTTGPLGCHSGVFMCDLRTSGLNGDCTEVLSDEQADQCIRVKTNYTCQCQSSCTASCTDNQTCYGCCTCSAGSSPAPVCQSDGGAGPDGSAIPDGAAAVDGGAPADGPAVVTDGPAACVSFTGTVMATPVIAAAGAPPAATGGLLADGLYRTTAVKVHGLAAAPGSQVGAFGGQFRLQGTTIEMSYAGSSVSSFYGKGTITLSGTATITTTFSCSSGATTLSYDYSVTSTSTVDIITRDMGLTTVATYTRQ